MRDIYTYERLIFEDYWKEKNLDREQQWDIIKLLCRKFDVSRPQLCNSYRPNGAGAYERISLMDCGHIKLTDPTWLGELCHEFAHHLDYEKYNHLDHGPTFLKCHRLVFTYAKRFL